MRRVAGRDRGGRRERRCVLVDLRVAGEVAYSGPAGQQWMAVASDDGGGEFEETLAPQEGWKRHAGVGAAAMQVALPVLQEPQALGERRRGARRGTGPRASSSVQGDRIRWIRNDAGLGLVNSRTAEVLSVANGRVTFQLEDGKRFELGGNDPQLRHLDHAWAFTVHAFQGRTVDNVIAAREARHPHLTTQKSFYAEISRARGRAELVTDDAAELRSQLQAVTGECIAAIEGIGEMPGKARLAALIDAENASARHGRAAFEVAAALGEATVRRIYGDFSNGRLASWTAAIRSFATVQHQQPDPTRGKNAADIALVIDVMDADQ